MKRNIRGTWLLIPALLVVTAALGLAVLHGNAGTENIAAHEITGLNAPDVTVRLIETRTTRIEGEAPFVEIPALPALQVEIPIKIAPVLDALPPADPIVEVNRPVTLVAPAAETYQPEPMVQPLLEPAAQPHRQFTFLH